jgi:hypothetical protein
MFGFFICFIIKKRYCHITPVYLQTLSKKKNQFFKNFGTSSKLPQKSVHQQSNHHKHVSLIDTNKMSLNQNDNFNKNNYGKI